MSANIMGNRIHAKRVECGFTLEELGERVGVNKTAIRKWEQGDVVNIKRDNLEKLASIFGVSPAWLVGFENNDIEKHNIQIELTENNRPTVSMDVDPGAVKSTAAVLGTSAALSNQSQLRRLAAYQELVMATAKVKPENYDAAIKMLKSLSE